MPPSESRPTDVPNLRPATPEEFAEAISFALRFDGQRPFPQAFALMANITAEHLVKHLRRYRIHFMKEPDEIAPDASRHPRAGAREPDTP